jgi:hypothetical protein
MLVLAACRFVPCPFKMIIFGVTRAGKLVFAVHPSNAAAIEVVIVVVVNVVFFIFIILLLLLLLLFMGRPIRCKAILSCWGIVWFVGPKCVDNRRMSTSVNKLGES